MMITEFLPEFRAIVLIQHADAASFFIDANWFSSALECRAAAQTVLQAYCTSAFREFLRANLQNSTRAKRVTDLDLKLAKLTPDSQTVLSTIQADPKLARSLLEGWIAEEINGSYPEIRKRIRDLLALVPRAGEGDFSNDASAECYNSVAAAIIEFERSLPSSVPFNRLFWDEGYFKGYSYPPDIFRRLQGGTIA